MLGSPIKQDRSNLIKLAINTGLWEPEDAETLLGSSLDSFFDGSMPENQSVKVFEYSGQIVGWAYYAESFHAPGVWDVWWIGIDPKFQSKGLGRSFLSQIESDIESRSGRLIIIETSSTPPLEKARSFYPALGYRRCGEVPDFYGVNDNKIIFAKKL